MRIVTGLLVLMLSVPAMAQEDASAAPDTDTARVALAQQMHDIWPVRPRVEAALNVIAETLPEENRLAFKAQMRKSIQFDLLEQESVKAMADIFTQDELKKMVEFYGSSEGRSISAKTEDYEIALRPVLMRMMDRALLDTRLGGTPAQ